MIVHVAMAVAAHTIRLNPGFVLVLGLLALVNIALLITALVSLIKRPVAAVRFHNKWVWGALIVLVNWIGPLTYLAVGRIDTPLAEPAGLAGAPAAERARRAVELLYGPPERQ